MRRCNVYPGTVLAFKGTPELGHYSKHRNHWIRNQVHLDSNSGSALTDRVTLGNALSLSFPNP